MKSVIPRSTCPISYTLDFFGDKWTLLIMRDLLLNGKSSFSEFLVSSEKIASNILVNRLNLLVKEGLLTKAVSPANKSKYLYRPTQKGIDLIPVLCGITLWGEQYGPKGASEAFTGLLKTDPSQTIANLKKRFEDGVDFNTEI